MYHAIEDNKLYNLRLLTETSVFIYNKQNTYDTSLFLDDVSIWIDNNRNLINAKYIGLANIAVGISPYHVSAFIYGFFCGIAFQMNELKIEQTYQPVSKTRILKKIEDNISLYAMLFERTQRKRKETKKEDTKPKKKYTKRTSNGK